MAWLKNQCMSEPDDSKFYEHNVTLEEHQRHSLEHHHQHQGECGSGDSREVLTPPALLSRAPSPDLTSCRGGRIMMTSKFHQPLSDIILSSMNNGRDGGEGTSSSTATASMSNSDSGIV